MPEIDQLPDGNGLPLTGAELVPISKDGNALCVSLSSLLATTPAAPPAQYLYVGGEGASDANDGATPETSLATLDAALARTPTGVTLLSAGSYTASAQYLDKPRWTALTIWGAVESWTAAYEDLAFTGTGHTLTITAWASPENQPAEDSLVGKIARLSGGAYRAITANVDDTIRVNYPPGLETGPLDIVDFDAVISLPAVVCGGVSRTGLVTFSGVTVAPSETYNQYPEVRGSVHFDAQVASVTSTVHFVRADLGAVGASRVLACRGTACAAVFSQCTGVIAGRFGAVQLRHVSGILAPEVGDFYIVGATCEDLTVRHSTVNAETAELVVTGTLDLDRFSDLIDSGGTESGPYSGVYPVP